MKIFEKIGDFVENKDIEITLFNNKVYVINYIDIEDFNTNRIVLKHTKGTININGKNLVIVRLINKELLICGEIVSIELR